MRRVAVILLLAGCATAATDAADGPVATMTTMTGSDSPRQRIVALDGDVAEIVFALGFGGQVVATDLSATYPPEADALPQIGYQRALTSEPILAFDPTLLIGTDTAGPPEVVRELARIVPVEIIRSAAGPAAPAAKVRAVAEVLGARARGESLAADVQAAIDAATPAEPASEPAAGLRVAMLYIRGESTQLLFGAGSGIDWLIEATGATDVADELGVVEHAELSAEALISAAPHVLLVTEDGIASVGGIDGLVALPTIAATPAAATRSVLAYDAQLMLGNGPRTGEFLARLRADLNDLATHLTEEP